MQTICFLMILVSGLVLSACDQSASRHSKASVAEAAAKQMQPHADLPAQIQQPT